MYIYIYTYTHTHVFPPNVQNHCHSTSHQTITNTLALICSTRLAPVLGDPRYISRSSTALVRRSRRLKQLNTVRPAHKCAPLSLYVNNVSSQRCECKCRSRSRCRRRCRCLHVRVYACMRAYAHIRKYTWCTCASGIRICPCTRPCLYVCMFLCRSSICPCEYVSIRISCFFIYPSSSSAFFSSSYCRNTEDR